MNSDEVGKKYVELLRAGKRSEVLDTLFSPEATSAEPFPPPGRERVVKGLEAIRSKAKFFLENNVIHRDELQGPYPHGDRFAIRFSFDVTFKPTCERRARDEIGLFTVKDGKIISEEFFYSGR